ncbi:hypothetical protein LTR84_005481 [Exophiala bonariae]|uniref:MARVEL domain-containing protein n=1 Tax=Exophiala bonariae TaxID=1690606 RepID=A0AAV9N816_9EURO|nr:hypothetical protein LTR84_005481 [Exophiala bonariae]
MPVISRVVSMILRAGELAFAGIVAGVVGKYLHDYRSGSAQPLARFIYIEVLAGISLLLGLLWLLPFSSGFVHWPVDVFISVAWFAAFGILISFNGTCGRWRATEAFSFLSAIFWLVSALVGIWFIRRERRKAAPVAGTYTRRRWFGHRRSAV